MRTTWRSPNPSVSAPATRDSYRFEVPDANHHISLTGLPPGDAEKALATLRRWAVPALPAGG